MVSSPERVYALIVEANPIPDPHSVPAAPTPALPNERRSVMLTHKATEANRNVARPAWLKAIGAFTATVLVIGAAVVIWGIANDRPVAAGDARIEVTFTGDATSYIGHREIIEGEVELLLVNQAATRAWFVVQRFDTGSAELDEHLAYGREGEHFVTTAEPTGLVEFYQVLPAGSGASPATPSIVLEPGTYLIDAGLDADEGEGTQVYRAAVIEVVSD